MSIEHVALDEWLVTTTKLEDSLATMRRQRDSVWCQCSFSNEFFARSQCYAIKWQPSNLCPDSKGKTALDHCRRQTLSEPFPTGLIELAIRWTGSILARFLTPIEVDVARKRSGVRRRAIESAVLREIRSATSARDDRQSTVKIIDIPGQPANASALGSIGYSQCH
jgi:hypothetical protein